MKAILKESNPGVIINSFSFTNSKGEIGFILKYLDPIPTDETYIDKDGNEKRKWDNDHISSLFIDKKVLPENYQKLDDKKICQDLKGKSVLKTVILTDE